MTHEFTYPDCPYCGREMQRYMRHGDKSAAFPIFGKPIRWWQCDACGLKTPEADSVEEALEKALEYVKSKGGENA